jgi:hypothetical protein
MKGVLVPYLRSGKDSSIVVDDRDGEELVCLHRICAAIKIRSTELD